MNIQIDSREASSLYLCDGYPIYKETYSAIQEPNQVTEPKDNHLAIKIRSLLVEEGTNEQPFCLVAEKDEKRITWLFETASLIDYLITH